MKTANSDSAAPVVSPKFNPYESEILMHPAIRIGALILAILIIPLTAALYFSLGHFLSPINVGIIGGADGPTAILLTPNSIGILFVLTVSAFALGALLISMKIKRDKLQMAEESDEEIDIESEEPDVK